MKYYKLFIISVLMLSACKRKEADFSSFDVLKFKEDRGGCADQREFLIEDLKKLKPKILGLTENQVIENLGRYDIQVLSRRNEKIFVYFLEKGEHCLAIQNKTEARSMILRFNAASLVKEVNFQIGTPLEMEY
jgi:hypothetical protein